MLLKAKRLYELAYSVHDMDHDPLFQFAVINNIAMIEQMLGNTAVSDDCMDYLVSLFMLLLDQGFHTHFHHVRGFVANLPSNSNFAVAA
ncbi:unnamed protein product [Cylindrotheca closterium]|uniref:Uncharacterized protein n=1 Tax=Cylindrotheca closterium TaxID=2856 RepID=A0AAD2PXD3_9STRA|nr:unnamed protein product [Cylindrotheca closterium]